VEHVVFYPGADGAEAFSRAADLEEAVRVVERLRNDNGVGDVSVFALRPVPLAFRTYVHVELSAVEQASDEAEVFETDVVEIKVFEPQAVDLAAVEPEPSEAEVAEVVEVVAPAVVEPELVESQLFETGLFESETMEVAGPEADVAEPSIPPPPPTPLRAELVEPEPAEVEPAQVEDAPVEVGLADGDLVEHAPAEEPAPLQDVPTEVMDLPVPPPPPSDFIEPIEDDQLTGLPVEEPHVEEAQVEPFDYFATPAPTDEPAAGEDDAPVPVPSHESSASELPPLTLAPGPLLFDGEDTPIGNPGSYDAVEEAAAELTALIPADFTDLIPKDIVIGDLARHVDGAAPAAELEHPGAPVEALVEPVEPVELVEPVPPIAEPAPGTDELPPMAVAEIPSDVSSIETLDGAAIPAARETHEEPVASSSHREGPRGLGYFGG
jgi:hypothetical protein